MAGLFGNPAGGWLVDRIGARRCVVVGLVLAAGGTVAIAAVDHAWHGFVAAGLYGLGMAVLLPAEDAFLATAVSDEQRPHVFALRHATMNIGFSVGALAAALVLAGFAGPTGFVVLYLVDAASFLMFAVVVSRLADVAPGTVDVTEIPEFGGYREVLRDPVFGRLWMVVVLLVAGGYAQYHAAFPAFATEVGGLSAGGLSVAFAANTVTVVAAQLVVLRLMAGSRRTRGVMLSAAFVAAAWIAAVLAAGIGGGTPALIVFAAAMVLFGLGETLLSPTVPAIVNDLAPERLRGRYNGAYSLAWTTGYIVGPALAGFALAAQQGYALFVVLIVVLAAAGLGAWRLERLLPPSMNRIDADPALDHSA